ncbi:hypothetical protein KR51_00037600 [Rubidibacter lacunae KORDI 51-2]|uniref:Uncharacterized protein n=1 Tax=Rubidibacter lacunae KORDI 51-2 TaxID=582515 RepID=U5DER3_9CHRO|nr:hypothetical protein KR51_00037600 [Rubidibacter lacunae KORDI 51-2]
MNGFSPTKQYRSVDIASELRPNICTFKYRVPSNSLKRSRALAKAIQIDTMQRERRWSLFNCRVASSIASFERRYGKFSSKEVAAH